MKDFSSKVLFISVFVLFIFLFYYFDGHHFLSFSYIKQNLNEFKAYYELYPGKTLAVFIGVYLFLTALAIPGSIVLTILSGAVFGTFTGVVLVTLAGTLGATISFLSSRYMLQDFVSSKFKKQFMTINRNLEQDGILYLFTLRFIPVSPFVVINLVMGITSLRTWTFIWTTALGMLPGNWIYVYAGKKIGDIDAPSEIMTPSFLIALTLLGILPWIFKKFSRMHKKRIAHV